MKRFVLFTLFASTIIGCIPNTEFKGDAKFPGGAPACFQACQAQNMEMRSFVYTGEFSTSCVCGPHDQAASTCDDSGSEVAAITGVVMQRRRAEAAARNNQSTMSTHH
jgi:hypothetical protein